MARRQSKAASRKARQRRVQRPLATTTPAPVARPALEEPMETAESAAPEPRRVTAPSAARAYSAASSSLTERERAEYHYVERDLRNIGILTAVLIGLLIAAWAVFNALGLVG